MDSENTPEIEEVAEVEAQATEFKTLTEATAAYAELENSSQALLEEAASKIETLEAAVESKDELLATALSDLEISEKAGDEAEARVAELEASEQSAERKAAAIAASVGVDPVEVEEIDNSEPTSKLEQLNSLTGIAKSQFYQANKPAIIAEYEAAK